MAVPAKNSWSPGAVALAAGDDEDALALEVGRRFDLQRHLRLVEGIDLRQRPVRTQ